METKVKTLKELILKLEAKKSETKLLKDYFRLSNKINLLKRTVTELNRTK